MLFIFNLWDEEILTKIKIGFLTDKLAYKFIESSIYSSSLKNLFFYKQKFYKAE